MPETPMSWESRRFWEDQHGRPYVSIRPDPIYLQVTGEIGKIKDRIYGLHGVAGRALDVSSYLKRAGITDGLGLMLIRPRLNDYRNRQIEEVLRGAINQYRSELPSELQVRAEVRHRNPDVDAERDFLLEINDLERYARVREGVREYYPTTPEFWYQHARDILSSIERRLISARGGHY